MGKIIGHFLLPHPPLLIPQIGRGNQHVAYRTCDAMMEVSKKIGELNPDNIIVITPHGASFQDGISILDSFFIEGDFNEFGSDFAMEKELNKTLSTQLKDSCLSNHIPLIPLDQSNAEIYDIDYKMDHGTMVPLYFIDKFHKKYKLTSITYGGLNSLLHYKFGMVLKEAIENLPGTYVIISSGDLSHKRSEDSPYGFHPSGEAFDNSLIESLKTGSVEDIFALDDNLIQSSLQCALKSILVLLGTLDKSDFTSEVLSYEHPFGVSYCVIETTPTEARESKLKLLTKLFEKRLEDMKKNAYVFLAQNAIKTYLETGDYLRIPTSVPENCLSEKRGAFVSLKMAGELRGCMGTIIPTCTNLGEEIIRNAVLSCSQDPRFAPVSLDELPFLTIHVDVLNTPEACLKEDLDPAKYGVIVSCGTKHGVLLPNLEGIDTVDSQLDTVLLKAGILPEEKYSIERFTVTRHGC